MAGLLVIVATLLGTLAHSRYLQGELKARATLEDQRLRVKLAMQEKRWSDAWEALVTTINMVETQFPSQASGLLAELEADRQVVQQHIQEEKDRAQARARLGKLRELDNKVQFEQMNNLQVVEKYNLPWAEYRDKIRRHLREGLAIYVPVGGEDAMSQLTEALAREKELLTADEFSRLTAAWYELLLCWAEAEAGPLVDRAQGRPPGNREASRQRGERALALLDQVGRLGRAYQLDTRIYYRRKARYLAQSRGEPL